ncbi:esterase/lipase family protein [Ramlibacter sp.]|uniref:esterase/lipase family protein n=1 Tax=Ramlibacter sp. TaxID=1917967 RepID=UPI0035AFAE4C
MKPVSRLAWLLRSVQLAQLLVIAAALVGLWPRSPAWALGVIVGVVLLLPAVLALQFLLLAHVARTDTPPVPTAAQLVRAWWAELCCFVVVFGGRMAWAWRRVPDQLPAAGGGPAGVVFIHGFVCNRGLWTPWMERLRAEGRPFVAVNLEPVFGSIESYRPIVDEAVARLQAGTGQRPWLVCHSMGGLAARDWLARTPGAAQRVAGLVTLGSPHGGTWLGRLSSVTNGRQMRLASRWLQALAQQEGGLPHPRTICWYANCDNIVFPTSSAMLAGADNRLVPGAAHVDLAFCPEVVEATLDLMKS